MKQESRLAQLTPMGPNKSLRFDVVRRSLEEEHHEPKRILEIGCGEGAFASRLAQWGEYVGLEPDVRSFSVARERLARLGRGEVRNVDFENFAADANFDLVCAFEVIEHLVDDRAALTEWSTLLAPGGFLLVSTPADPDRYNAYDQYVGHIRRYKPEGLQDVLESAGLSQVRVVRYGFPLYNLLELAYGGLASVRLKRSGPESLQDRTSKSGRVFKAPVGILQIAAIFHRPLQRLQRLCPSRGPGLVAYGRKPVERRGEGAGVD
jgi:SAM-dependent methyltransferase